MSKEDKYIGGQKDLLKNNESAIKKYKTFVLGDNYSFFSLIKYEIITLFFNSIPGAIGLFLRKIFFKRLFKECGNNVVFGRNMSVRHPGKICIGSNVIFDDYSVIDAKGNKNKGIKIGNNVVIGRNSVISCKGGDIEIGNFSNIGPNNTLISETSFNIGQYVYTSGHVYAIAGGNHGFEDRYKAIWEQKSISKGGIKIEDDVWIGASATILDGVHIQKGAIVGASSLVNKNVEELSIVGGVPAKLIKKR